MTSRQKWTLALTSAAALMVALDQLVVATALSTMQRDLQASIATLEWTVNAYSLTFGVLLITGAAVGNRFGRRRTLAAGLGGFTLASVVCALAPDTGTLIVARTVQGAGSALVMPAAVALLAGAFPAERRGAAPRTRSRRRCCGPGAGTGGSRAARPSAPGSTGSPPGSA